MSSGHQRIKWRRNIAKNFNRLSRVHERYRQTTDRRQTTDGRTTTYSEHEHEFTFAKNHANPPVSVALSPPTVAETAFVRETLRLSDRYRAAVTIKHQ